MVFNSYSFGIFFITVLIIYYSLSSWRGRKLLLLAASYTFYAAWNPPFVLLLWISTVADWYFAKALHATQASSVRKLWLIASLVLNLGLLAFFKYGEFALENFVALVKWLGMDFSPAQPNIILPVGISFYTFQTLSYTLDVYLQRSKPWHSFLDYALYVTFFPQLVAGPIVRAQDFLFQCEKQKTFSVDKLSWGLCWVIVGLFEKVVVADVLLAPIAEKLYASADIPDFTAAWIGTLAFSGQIFCDFAGYSTCAIGAALCLGFTLPDNFRFPYAAIGFSDFWRRWHVSLSSWLRDYLYIPLGGNRKGIMRTQVHLMITMLVGGLWHGAAWTFVIWGGLHGLFLMLERFLVIQFGRLSLWNHHIMQFALGIVTFLCICVTWVFFRAESFTKASYIFAAMFGFLSEPATLHFSHQEIAIALGVVSMLVMFHWLLRQQALENLVANHPWWVTSATIAVMLYLIATMPGEDRAFIYFQF